MKYVDLHCDTLTVSAKLNSDLKTCELQTNFEKLKKSDCAAQCFAVFTQGDGAARFFKESCDWYGNMLEKHKDSVFSVRNSCDLSKCLNGTKTGAVLTAEDIGFLNGDIAGIKKLGDAGVKMASLVWNNKNLFASPNLIFENGLPKFELRCSEGLTPLGEQAVEAMEENKIILDVSHLSDGGTLRALEISKKPVVASHSNAAEVCNVSRNLTDALIKKIAESGGVIGVNFCKDFLGEGDNFDLIYKHIIHIINAGGEDAVAFGSDFDGIPALTGMEDCTKMPYLLDYLAKRGIKNSTAEKLCFKNFMRVLREFD